MEPHKVLRLQVSKASGKWQGFQHQKVKLLGVQVLVVTYK